MLPREMNEAFIGSECICSRNGKIIETFKFGEKQYVDLIGMLNYHKNIHSTLVIEKIIPSEKALKYIYDNYL